MKRDHRAPVVVGAGQLTSLDRENPTSPLELMTEAVERALADTGADRTRVLDAIGSVGVTDCLSWRPPNAAAVLAERLGASPHTTVGTHTGGISPISLLTHACTGIANGDVEVALIAGGEAIRALSDGRYDRGPNSDGDAPPTVLLGTDRAANHPAETAVGLTKPAQFYPLFEHALRARAGRTPAEHDRITAELWSRFAAVAAEHPHAVVREPRTPEQVLDTDNGNRMINHPYRRAMTANIYTDQAAALIVCSVGAADAAGIPEDRRIHVHATADADEEWFVGNRADLAASPAIASLNDLLTRHLQRPVGDCDYVDLYSCFPSAVQVAAHEFGIELTERTPTLTGGLSFFGGPASNYAMHSMVTAVPLLRARPESSALCTAVGWYLTEHAATVLAARAPAEPYAHLHGEPETASRRIAEKPSGEARLETYTIGYDRDGAPETGYLSCLLADGSRALAAVTDPNLLAWLSETDPLDAVVLLDGAGGVDIPTARSADSVVGK